MSTDENSEGLPAEINNVSKVIIFNVRQPLLEMESLECRCQTPLVDSARPRRSEKGSNPTGSIEAGDSSAQNNCNGGSGGGYGGGNGRGDPPVQPIPDPLDESITLSSVGGLDEHVRYLKRAVMYPLKHQGALSAWGVDPPKGIMFHGPPGTGKTLLAKALANDLSKTLNKKFSFFYQKGGECFTKYFGESQRKLKELFFAANHYKPSIIFFDEIDGLCPDRSRAARHGTEAYTTVVTALLGMIDSVKRGDVFIIGATNRLDAVDPAIRRPGRFDKQLTFSLPCEDGRRHILGIHSKDWPHDRPTGELLTGIAKRTVGYTGADLEKVCRDTVVAAMSRSGDIPPEQVRITEEDWATAVQNMKHSSTNVFGSTMYIAQPISPILTPLVSNIIGEILTRLKPLIPEDHWISIPLMDNHTKDAQTPEHGPTLSRKSLLVWDLDPVHQHYTNNTILRGVLSHPSLGKMTTFILNDEALLTKMQKQTLMGALNSILQQALNSEKPCILYIPRIRVLEAKMHQQKILATFYRQLMRLRGTNVILLATSVGDLIDHSDEIADLFIGMKRSYNMRLPVEKERKQFYLQVFDGLIANEDVQAKKKKADKKEVDYSELFEAQLELAVELTEGDVFDYMLSLHEALSQEKSDYKTGTSNLKTLSENFESVLDRYARDKLQ